MTRAISIALVITTTVVLGIWAIIVGANDVANDEISVVILEAASRFKSIPLAFGILMGHWLWPAKAITIGKWRYFVLVGLVVATIATDIFLSYFTVFPLVPFVTGVALGHWLWPQKVREP